MNIITLDFETYFDDEYSLSKGYTTELYVRSEKFEAHGCAIRLPFDLVTGEGPAFTSWYAGADLHGPFDVIDWANTAVLCHHSPIRRPHPVAPLRHQAEILVRYLSMARLCLGNHLSVSLDSLAKHFGLQAKTVPYNLFKGKHWHELTPAVQQQVAAGACHDVDLTWEIFGRLMRGEY